MSEFGIETISEEDFRRAQQTATKVVVLEPRTRVVWFALPTHQGKCNLPDHEEVQKTLSERALAYRAAYPIREVFEIRPGVQLCRDCFLAGADKEHGTDT